VTGFTLAGLALAATPTTRAFAHRVSPAPEGAAAVLTWNATASAVMSVDAAMPAPTMAVGMAYVQAAVYNAVAGIRGAHLYRSALHGPAGASTDAAVAAAARRVLNTYFPIGTTRVEAAYAVALGALPHDAATIAGVSFGEQAAAHLIAQRSGDGWLAPVTFATPPAPGVWRPTPPANAAYLAPWLGLMKPFVLQAHDQRRPGPPPRLTSRRYARDLAEVAALGSAGSALRTAEQTEVARFFAGNLSVQLQGAYRDHAVRHGFGALSAARYLALATLAGADAVIAAWDAKLHYGFWRPVTAIRLADTDGNLTTTADPAWTPLLATPPFPDYISGHTTVIGSVTRALRALDGGSTVDLTLDSSVTGTTRHYADSATFNQEGVDARVWGGIHFRTADVEGGRVGASVGSWVAEHWVR
jgi:hypothetical protein